MTDHHYQAECSDTIEALDMISKEPDKYSHFVKSDALLPSQLAGTIEANDMRYRCGLATRADPLFCPVQNTATKLMRYATQAVQRKAIIQLNVDHKQLPKSPAKSWILDSGAACDIICRLSLQYLVPHRPKQIANYIHANGPVRCTEMFTISVGTCKKRLAHTCWMSHPISCLWA